MVHDLQALMSVTWYFRRHNLQPANPPFFCLHFATPLPALTRPSRSGRSLRLCLLIFLICLVHLNPSFYLITPQSCCRLPFAPNLHVILVTFLRICLKFHTFSVIFNQPDAAGLYLQLFVVLATWSHWISEIIFFSLETTVWWPFSHVSAKSDEVA